MKYRPAEEEELERVKKWMRGVFVRPPAPIALECKLSRGDDGESMLVRLERDDITALGKPDDIAEHLFQEARNESERLTGRNRYIIYLYREGFKDGKRANGHILFYVDSPEEEDVEVEIGRTTPLSEKGFTEALMRFSLEERRQMRDERTQLYRHFEGMIASLSGQVQRMMDQQLQVIEVTNLALDRKEERALAVEREKRSDAYKEMAAKQFIPLLGPVMSKVLQRFAPDFVGPDQSKEADAAVAPEGRIAYQLAALLGTFEQSHATKFRDLMSEEQKKLFLTELLPLLSKRETEKTAQYDMAIACLIFDFIALFTEEQTMKMGTLGLSQEQIAAFMALYEEIKNFEAIRVKQAPSQEAKAAE